LKKVSDLLQSALAGAGKQYAEVSRAYIGAVGPAIAKKTRPVKLDGKSLLVAVSDNIWLSELAFIKEDIVDRMRESGIDITEIKFYYKKFDTEIKKKEKHRRTPDEKELRMADSISETLPEGELREAVRKAIRSYFTMYDKNDFLNC